MLRRARFLGQPFFFKQVLFNVVENAVKFSKELDEILIHISSQDTGDNRDPDSNIKTILSVVVQDNGIGIRE